MSAKRRLAVSVGGLWLCSGRLDQKKIQFFFLARLGWFSVADVTCDFWNCAFLADTTAGVWPIGLGVEPKSKSGIFFCCIGPEHRRLEPRVEPILSIFSLLKRSKYANALG